MWINMWIKVAVAAWQWLQGGSGSGNESAVPNIQNHHFFTFFNTKQATATATATQPLPPMPLPPIATATATTKIFLLPPSHCHPQEKKKTLLPSNQTAIFSNFPSVKNQKTRIFAPKNQNFEKKVRGKERKTAENSVFGRKKARKMRQKHPPRKK
jgi:hypothetical protein